MEGNKKKAFHAMKSVNNEISVFSMNFPKEPVNPMKGIRIGSQRGKKQVVGKLWGRPIIIGDINLLGKHEIFLDKLEGDKSEKFSLLEKHADSYKFITDSYADPIYGTIDLSYDDSNYIVEDIIPLPSKLEDIGTNIYVEINVTNKTIFAEQGYTTWAHFKLPYADGEYSLEEVMSYLPRIIKKPLPTPYAFNNFKLCNPLLVFGKDASFIISLEKGLTNLSPFMEASYKLSREIEAYEYTVDNFTNDAESYNVAMSSIGSSNNIRLDEETKDNIRAALNLDDYPALDDDIYILGEISNPGDASAIDDRVTNLFFYAIPNVDYLFLIVVISSIKKVLLKPFIPVNNSEWRRYLGIPESMVIPVKDPNKFIPTDPQRWIVKE